MILSRFPGRALALALLIGLPGCDPGETAPADAALKERMARARALLAEAGFPAGKGFPRVEILYNTDSGHERIASALQQMWRKTLGIEVALRNTEWKVYLDDLSQRRYQVARRAWIADYRDPYTFIEMFSSTSRTNNTGWSSAEYDRLIKDSSSEPDPARRFDLLRRAEAILLRESPIMPLYFYRTQNCWKDSVKGLFPNALDTHPLKEVTVEGKDVLVINNPSEASTLDPGLARGSIEHRILIGLFEGLVTLEPGTLKPRPGVAERWEVSPDGRTYTFHLRDCEWSDGRKVTAGDFVYAWTRVLTPSTPTDYARILYFIRGAEAFNTKASPDPSGLGLRARDDRTLEVELANPCPFFPELCAFFTYYPVRRDVIEKHGSEWTRPGHLVSNGPFLLKERKVKEATTIERNPRYWDAARVRLPRVRFLAIENRATAWTLYKEGACDFVTTLPLDQVEEIMKRPDYRGEAHLATYFYAFNVTRPPLDDPRVRRALSLAADRETLVARVLRQGQAPAYHLVPPAWPDYRSPRLDDRE
jgi:ABC-type oligopeptide transport system substrate-binding subunit